MNILEIIVLLLIVSFAIFIILKDHNKNTIKRKIKNLLIQTPEQVFHLSFKGITNFRRNGPPREVEVWAEYELVIDNIYCYYYLPASEINKTGVVPDLHLSARDLLSSLDWGTLAIGYN